MQNRTVGIIATVLTAIVCGCLSIFSCIWGGMIAAGQPINTTVNGETSQQILPAPIGYLLLGLTLIMILVPVAVGFFTLRKKPEPPAVLSDPMPPAS